jgi:hypothetical protein
MRWPTLCRVGFLHSASLARLLHLGVCFAGLGLCDRHFENCIASTSIKKCWPSSV